MGPKIINKITLIITIIKPRIKATDLESWHLKPEVLHIVSEFGWREEKRSLKWFDGLERARRDVGEVDLERKHWC